MKFEFISADKIVFGSGSFSTLGNRAKAFGKKFMIVSQQIHVDNGIVPEAIAQLKAVGCESICFLDVAGEPDEKTVDNCTALAAQNGCDAVIGIGGGSCIDVAKATGGLLTNGGHVREYLEGVGTGRVLDKPTAPFIAVPTTSGTGAEVTKNAVIMSKTEHFKKSFRAESLLARVAIVDPCLTVSVPKSVTASTGMDAITQLIESYTSAKSQPMTDALAIYALKGAPEMLKRAYDNGNDLEAREHMSRCSLFSGLTLANSGLGGAHGIAAALGANFSIAHGTACAMLLPYIMEYNISGALDKLADVGEVLTGKSYTDKKEAAYAGIKVIKELCQYLEIPEKLSQIGVKPEDFEQLAHDSMGSSMSGNPVKMDEKACAEFLKSIA